jgi:hypothetical protein
MISMVHKRGKNACFNLALQHRFSINLTLNIDILGKTSYRF